MITGLFNENGMSPVLIEKTGSYTYYAFVKPGVSNTGQSKFLIKMYDSATGQNYYADGSTEFNKEWDERASYTYKLPL